jgi:hypothetical protein
VYLDYIVVATWELSYEYLAVVRWGNRSEGVNTIPLLPSSQLYFKVRQGNLLCCWVSNLGKIHPAKLSVTAEFDDDLDLGVDLGQFY